jgi:hypothetical protein
MTSINDHPKVAELAVETHQQRLEEATTRFQKLIWLPAAMVSGSVTEDLREAIVDDLYQGDNKQILSKLPKLTPLLSTQEEPGEDWIAEALDGASGYFCLLARPVPSSFHGSKESHSYSWGHYATRWVYGEDMGELTALAEAFSEEILEQEYARHTANTISGEA